MTKLNFSKQDVEKELIAITKQLLIESGEPAHREVKLDISLERHLGIDSLARAELFQRIEKKFGVLMPDSLLASADSLNDILVFLSQDTLQPATPLKTGKIVTAHGDHSRVDPAAAKSLTDILFNYAEASPDKPHIFFQNENGQEEVITYGDLLKNASRVALQLKKLSIEQGDTVAIMLPSHPEFFYTFFGVLLAGAIPVPIYPPFRLHLLEAYAKTEARILSNAEVRALVTFEEAKKLSQLLKTFVPSLKHVTTAKALLQDEALDTLFHAKPNHYAFIQYTSGSTAAPKGVLLTHDNLISNIKAYGKAIHVKPDDVTVSWLPLYHDMGLIGMWLGSLYYGIPLVLLTPFSFLNHPERWLWAIHYHRGTLSGAPNFAYELCVRKIAPSLLEGLDLSSWRVAANGAEKIYPNTLMQFAEKFAPYGFKRQALMPVYGLAESTVALTIPPINRSFLIDKIDRKKFEEERIALPSDEPHALQFVACGKAMEGHEVRIVDEEMKVLRERQIGSLQFRGPSNMQGYYRNPEATAKIYHDGWIDSGDLAYMAEEEVYITGRRKDLIIKAGRNIYPAEIEEVVGAVPHVRLGCVAVFAVNDFEQATDKLVIVAETKEKNKVDTEELINAIREAVVSTLDIVPDHIILVRPHTVPKTSSGKLQRAACKNLYLEGKLNKSQTPPWMQILKLGAQSFFKKAAKTLGQILKFFYTAYVAFMVLISFLPLYLTVLFGSREVAAKACRLWARFILFVSFCPIKVEGIAHLTESPLIFAVNHASYLDSLVLLCYLPLETRFVGKKELFSAPIVGRFMRKLDYISIDRMNLPKGIEDTLQIKSALEKGYSIVIFPEGTFGYASGLRPFRLGAFKLSVETDIPVCPIALSGTRGLLRDDEKLLRPGRVKVTISTPIKPSGKEWQDVIQLRNAVREEIANHCGEPTLDLIAAERVAPKEIKS